MNWLVLTSISDLSLKGTAAFPLHTLELLVKLIVRRLCQKWWIYLIFDLLLKAGFPLHTLDGITLKSGIGLAIVWKVMKWLRLIPDLLLKRGYILYTHCNYLKSDKVGVTGSLPSLYTYAEFTLKGQFANCMKNWCIVSGQWLANGHPKWGPGMDKVREWELLLTTRKIEKIMT